MLLILPLGLLWPGSLAAIWFPSIFNIKGVFFRDVRVQSATKRNMKTRPVGVPSLAPLGSDCNKEVKRRELPSHAGSDISLAKSLKYTFLPWM